MEDQMRQLRKLALRHGQGTIQSTLSLYEPMLCGALQGALAEMASAAA